MLEVQNINSFYGKSHILHDVSLHIRDNELVTLLGRNGAGKTTTLKSIVGLVTPQSGSITFDGQPIHGLHSYVIAGRGVCLVPEHRGVFRLLTVEENLELGLDKASPWSLDDVYTIFPRLKERRRNSGVQLSGGEQQMLAIGRALLNNPKLLILDEPVEGLAPVIVEEIVEQLKKIRAAGVPILLVEQNLQVCTQLADRHYIIEQGRIVYSGTNNEFIAPEEVKDKYLSVS